MAFKLHISFNLQHLSYDNYCVQLRVPYNPIHRLYSRGSLPDWDYWYYIEIFDIFSCDCDIYLRLKKHYHIEYFDIHVIITTTLPPYIVYKVESSRFNCHNELLWHPTTKFDIWWNKYLLICSLFFLSHSIKILDLSFICLQIDFIMLYIFINLWLIESDYIICKYSLQSN